MVDNEKSIAISNDTDVEWSSDPEVMKAATYLVLRDQKQTMEQIAAAFNYNNRSSMYYQVSRWEEDGVLEKARRIYLVPKEAEIQAATDRVLGQWPAIIDKAVKIALHSRSDHNALEAIVWLENTVVRPALEKQRGEGNSEMKYAKKDKLASPMIITTPKFLQKGGEKDE